MLESVQARTISRRSRGTPVNRALPLLFFFSIQVSALRMAENGQINGSNVCPALSTSTDKYNDNRATVVLGAQWGDEGKGKLVDLLATHTKVVCRCQVSCLPKCNPFLGTDEFSLRVAIMLAIQLLWVTLNTISISYPPASSITAASLSLEMEL